MDKNTHSEFTLKNHAKVSVSDWFNKIKVFAFNHSEFDYKPRVHLLTESMMIETLNYAKVDVLTAVKRVQIRSKNHSEAYVQKVTEVADDRSENYAKITIHERPGNQKFVF